jgi:hypothetical protein
MVPKIRALGLALVTVLALGAFAAQGASATPLTVEGLTPPATAYLTGDQDGGTTKLTTNHGEVSCTTTTLAAKQATETGGVVSEITFTPTYSGCTAFGFATTDIKPNGCTYTFDSPTSLGGGQVTWSGASQIHLVCPTGKAIEVTPTSFGVSVCTQSLPPQTPTGGHIVGKNVTGSSPMDVTLEITLTGIHYTGNQANNSGPCTNSETHTETTLTGKSTIKCYKNEAHTEQVGCTFS